MHRDAVCSQSRNRHGLEKKSPASPMFGQSKGTDERRCATQKHGSCAACYKSLPPVQPRADARPAEASELGHCGEPPAAHRGPGGSRVSPPSPPTPARLITCRMSPLRMAGWRGRVLQCLLGLGLLHGPAVELSSDAEATAPPGCPEGASFTFLPPRFRSGPTPTTHVLTSQVLPDGRVLMKDGSIQRPP